MIESPSPRGGRPRETDLRPMTNAIRRPASNLAGREFAPWFDRAPAMSCAHAAEPLRGRL